MEDTEIGRCVYECELTRPGDTYTRFALASLVGSDRFWAAFVVGLPFVLVAASVAQPLFVSFAAGVPAVICLWLLWMSQEFVDTRFEVDVEAATLRKSKPYGDEYYAAVAADEFEAVSILRFSRIALVRFRYDDALATKPLAVAIETSDVRDVESALQEMGVDVSVRRASLRSVSTDPIHVRVLGTPVVVLGTLVAVGALHGAGAFATNGFVVPLVVVVLFALYGEFYRNRLGRDDA